LAAAPEQLIFARAAAHPPGGLPQGHPADSPNSVNPVGISKIAAARLELPNHLNRRTIIRLDYPTDFIRTATRFVPTRTVAPTVFPATRPKSDDSYVS